MEPTNPPEDDYVPPGKDEHETVTNAELGDILANPAAHVDENVIVNVTVGPLELKPCPSHITGTVTASKAISGKDDSVAGFAIFTEGDPATYQPTSAALSPGGGCRVMACPGTKAKVWATVAGISYKGPSGEFPMFRANHVDTDCEE